MVRKIGVLLLLGVLLGLGIGAPASAAPYSYTIDDFSITKGGAALFADSFDDGAPPPSAPDLATGGGISYDMLGTMGPEDTGAPGRLTIDQSGAVVAVDPTGGVELFQRARLATNVQPVTASTLGLKNNAYFTVSGVFDLNSLPSQDGDQFASGSRISAPVARRATTCSCFDSSITAAASSSRSRDSTSSPTRSPVWP